jgi:hypothetical protein
VEAKTDEQAEDEHQRERDEATAEPASVFAGLALVIILGHAFSWVYATIGLAAKDPRDRPIAGILPFEPSTPARRMAVNATAWRHLIGTLRRSLSGARACQSARPSVAVLGRLPVFAKCVGGLSG